ncbi:hypothetical protein K456DRAFT_1120597 [Colletotrichum gloeosporioides 23]|nr:hypothetical protein K456DRAFT_1120597 [Colletotrichum gloeosporioides 23]
MYRGVTAFHASFNGWQPKVKTLSGWRSQISTVGTRGKHRVWYSFACQLGWTRTWTWLSSAACCFIWRYFVLPQLGRLALFSTVGISFSTVFFSFWVIGITGRGSGDRSTAHLQGGLQGNCVVGFAMSRPAMQIQYTSHAQFFFTARLSSTQVLANCPITVP